MPITNCLIDSNVLLRWVQPHLPVFPTIQSAIDRLVAWDTLLCYSSQNVSEFWNTCTRPVENNGFGLNPHEADQKAAIFENRLLLLPDSEEVHHLWRTILVEKNISGVQVHDARLAALMQIHGIRHILTFNTRDFSRYNEITAVHPEDVK